MDQIFVNTPTAIAVILGLVGLALGPGGVFFVLVKKSLNGTVQSIERMDRTINKMSACQNLDHDSLTKAVAALEDLRVASSRYHSKVDQQAITLNGMRIRCEMLHRDWAVHKESSSDEDV
jgi:hypothetical protein